jgi:hypothetical protein
MFQTSALRGENSWTTSAIRVHFHSPPHTDPKMANVDRKVRTASAQDTARQRLQNLYIFSTFHPLVYSAVFIWDALVLTSFSHVKVLPKSTQVYVSWGMQRPILQSAWRSEIFSLRPPTGTMRQYRWTKSCLGWHDFREGTFKIFLLAILFTHGAEPFWRSRQLCSYSRTSQHFTEPKGSLPCSQDQSDPYHLILSL